jgi:hypothetical protein
MSISITQVSNLSNQLQAIKTSAFICGFTSHTALGQPQQEGSVQSTK